MLRNTTNIPDRLVAIAAAYAIAGLRSGDGVAPPVSQITIKNKARGKLRGKWGWYYHEEKEVVVIVPRQITRRYIGKFKFSKRPYEFSSRGEFLVMLLAHELRHAWQYNNWNTPAMSWRLERTRVAKYAREVDAELYELVILRKWQHEVMPLLKEVA